MTTFRELGVLPEICDALERVGITTPFAIQEMTLSVALLGTDLIGQARTGTGKTLAFGIPVLQRSVVSTDPAYADLPQGKPQALVVAPTRELALQVSQRPRRWPARTAASASSPSTAACAYEPQLEALSAASTSSSARPGRLIDLANRRSLDLSHVHALVLDEADEMLDLGFLPDVERLLRMTPETRQTMLFSATMPGAIVSLARTHMRHPMNIRAESSYDTQLVPATAQFIFQAHDLDKPEIIGRILQAEDAEQDHRLHPHQASGPADRRRPRRARLQGRAAARRHGAGRPREGAEPRSARTRSGSWSPPTSRPAASTSGRLARHQLHLPRGREDLHPPDRPHRSRRCDRDRGHLRRLGRPATAGR